MSQANTTQAKTNGQLGPAVVDPAVVPKATRRRFGREVLNLKRIVAIVSPDNDRSRALLGKLGLHFERMITWPDDGSEIELYAVG